MTSASTVPVGCGGRQGQGSIWAKVSLFRLSVWTKWGKKSGERDVRVNGKGVFLTFYKRKKGRERLREQK